MDKNSRLIIRGLSTISSLGVTSSTNREIWQNASGHDRAPWKPLSKDDQTPVFPLGADAERLVGLVNGDSSYQRLDRVSQLGVAAAKETISRLIETDFDISSIGCVAMGSSRGATNTLESSFKNFNSAASVSALTSPVTTAGNISSAVAQEILGHRTDTGSSPEMASINTSMTCSSAFHSLLVARAFLLSGMTRAALFGGAESALTPYTVAQLKALRIYSDRQDSWPCRAIELLEASQNTVVLGEGAGTAVIFAADSKQPQDGDLELVGIGWAMERIPSPTGITEDGAAFEKAMREALKSLGSDDTVAAVVMHAPGSRRGDQAELQAVQRVLGGVQVYTTKHLTGHTYGAAPMLNLSLADAILAGLDWSSLPYGGSRYDRIPPSRQGNVVLVNSAGFGGNAVSVAVRKPT